MDIVCAGRCFFLAATPQDKRHLWIILTDPDGTPHEVVAVMVRTAKKFTDDTVILAPGDHPFISVPSSVHFSTATRFRVTEILRMSARKDCGVQPDASPKLLARVREGLMKSPFTIPRIRDYCTPRFK